MLVVEANYDVGGHAMLSGGNVPLGGGTSAQRKYGIEDTPDTVFADLTDWSIVQSNGWPDYRYNDRAVMRAFADHCAATYEFLVANGVKFKEIPPDNAGAHSTGNSAPRENHTFWTDGTGLASPSGRAGTGLVRSLEASARAKGVKFLLHYKMTSLIRTASSAANPGRVIGLTAQYAPRILPGTTTPLQSYRAEGNIDSTKPSVSIRATKAVILATGNWHDLIFVNQLGQRFYDETKGDYPHGNVYNNVHPYTPGDYRHNARITYDPTAYNFFNAAAAMNAASGSPDYAAGPIWAIAVAANVWPSASSTMACARLASPTGVFWRRSHPASVARVWSSTARCIAE